MVLSDDEKMLEIDGSMGEGGGQILRTALSLSLHLKRPFHIANIRLHRRKPGLQRQHLAAVMAAATLSRAEVKGAELDSTDIYFTPHEIIPGHYRFDIGSAGSTTLLLQALLLPLALAGSPSHLHLIGGTHNPMAPTFEFLKQAYLPLLRRMGAKIDVEMVRPGFYPCGGGELVVRIKPVKQLLPLSLLKRGAIEDIKATAFLARLPAHIAERELGVVATGLELAEEALITRRLDQVYCPGNALEVQVKSEGCTELFSAIGRRGISAEVVADTVVEQAREYLAAGVPVGKHLADQLLLPLALAGEGSFLTLEPDLHTPTNITLIKHFLPLTISTTELGSDNWRIDISSANR